MLQATCSGSTLDFEAATSHAASAWLNATYFDGISSRARAVRLRLSGKSLQVSGESIDLQVPLADVQWPERTRHGKRVAHFNSGGLVQTDDAAAWDAWSQAGGQRESWVVRWQQSWHWVAGCVVALVLAAVALQQWGLPVAARALVAVTPLSVDKSLGDASLVAIDEHLMRPSKLPAAEQTRLRSALANALKASPAGSIPDWKLVFRKSRIGPNAFALPGGTLVMTDELVALVKGDEQVLTAVLAHEIGHVRHRHGVRMLLQTMAIGALSSVVLGDFSTVLAGVPMLLGQASYSREAEREADLEAVRILKAAAISPAVMVTLFEKLEEKRQKSSDDSKKPKDSRSADKQSPVSPETEENIASKTDGDNADESPQTDSWLGIAFASHPSDAERIRFFRDAAGQ